MKVFPTLLIWGTILFVNIQNSQAQTSFNLNGYVKDAESGELLTGVAVVKTGSNIGTVTDENGYYSLSL